MKGVWQVQTVLLLKVSFLLASVTCAQQITVEELIQQLRSTDPGVRNEAVLALGKMGAAAKPAVPVIVEILEAEFDRSQASTTPGFEDVSFSVDALIALDGIGPEAEDAVPLLLRLLKNADFALRILSATTLGAIGSNADVVVPALVEALDDSVPGVQGAAAYALGRFGLAAADALPALKRLHARNEDEELRQSIAEALARIEPTVEELVEMLRSADPKIRKQAASALGNRGAAAGPVLAELIELLQSEDPELRKNVSFVFLLLGEEARPVLPALLELLRSSDRELRDAVFEILGFWRDGASPAVPVVVELLEADDARLRAEAKTGTPRPDSNLSSLGLTLLEGLGPKAEAAVPTLLRLLKSVDPWMRSGAAKALGSIGSSPGTVVPALVEALGDPKSIVRTAAAVALGEIGPAAAPALPRLKRLHETDLSEGQRRTVDAVIAKIEAGSAAP